MASSVIFREYFNFNSIALFLAYEVCLLSNAITSLDAVTAPTHDVNVTCTDSAGGSASAILYVDVTQNYPPVITGLPVTVQVLENEVLERKLHDLTVTDQESDTFTCVLTTSPAVGPFDLRRDAVTLGNYISM